MEQVLGPQTEVKAVEKDDDADEEEGEPEPEKEEEAEEEEEDKGADEDEGDEEEEEEESKPPVKPLYIPTKGEKLSKQEMWDNFTIKALKMTEDDDDEEEEDDEEDEEGTCWRLSVLDLSYMMHSFPLLALRLLFI